MDTSVNVHGVLTVPDVTMIKDHVNSLHVFYMVKIHSLKIFSDYSCLCKGVCINTSDTEFKCKCDRGYEGKRCEKTVDFCANVTCQNRGVCSQQFLNYTCNCLAGFNGRHCEITERSAVIRGYVTKSNFFIFFVST